MTGIAGSTAKISYTVTADQYITITANGKPVVEEMQGSGDSKDFALTTANITGKTLEIKVVVTEDNTLKVTNTPSASTTVEYAIDGAGNDATDAAYSIVAEDIGKTVTVTVTVTHAGYADLVLTYEITVAA